MDLSSSRGLPAAMAAALRAAEKGAGWVSPNPLVGAALLTPDGRIRARGHLRFGGPHAEARLLGAPSAGDRPHTDRLPPGCTLFLTLEPCAHTGKTPPCVDLVLQARPARVVIAALDPDPRVGGRGARALRDAGIEVVVGTGEEESLGLNLAFALRHRLRRSLLRVKLASTLDARLAPETGPSRWITGPEARRRAHGERARSDAVLVGSSTVLADDPELTVRHVRGPQPSRIVLDSSLRTPPRCRIWRAWRRGMAAASPGAGPGTGGFPAERSGNWVAEGGRRGKRYRRRSRAILATAAGWPAARLDRYRSLGWEVWELPRLRGGPVSLPALARRAAREGLLRLLIEAGPALAGALLAADLADEISLYQAPMVLGGSRAWPSGWGAKGIGGARCYRLLEERAAGRDLWRLYRREGLLQKARFRVHRPD